MTWIKMRSNLWDDPRISRLCDLTGRREAEVIGGLYWLWTMADEQTEDGKLPGLSISTIDRKTGVKGLGAALVKIGWVSENEEGVELVRFDEHNGQSAKRRAQVAKNVDLHRAKTKARNQNVITGDYTSDTEQLHHDYPDKIREDKIRLDTPLLVPTGDGEGEAGAEIFPAATPPALSRLRALFRIRPESNLDISTRKAWEKNKKSAAALTESEWSVLEWAYRQKEGDAAKYRRRDLATLLNNLTTEVTRAREWSRAAGATPGPATEPEGWRDIVEAEYPECNLSTWAALPESMKAFVHFQLRAAQPAALPAA